MPDLLVTGIGQLTTNIGEAIPDAAVAISDGRIVYAGPDSDAPDQGAADRIECGGRAGIPGC